MSDSVRPRRRQPTRLPRPWDSPGKNTGVGCHFLLQCMKVKSQSEVAQSCLTLRDPVDCSLPGSSIHGIFQARVLEWGAIAFSSVESNLKNADAVAQLLRRSFSCLMRESKDTVKRLIYFSRGHYALFRRSIKLPVKMRFWYHLWLLETFSYFLLLTMWLRKTSW